MSDTPNFNEQQGSSTTLPVEVDRSSTLDALVRRGPEPPGPAEPRNRKRWLALAAILLLAIGGWIVWRWLSQHSQAARQAQKGTPTTPVVAATAHKGDIGVYFTGLGAVTPLYTVTSKTRVDGQILNVYYKEGQAVRKGDPLVEIDPRPYEAQLTQAEGQLLKDQAALQNAQTDLQRYQTLITKNAVAQQVLATQKATVLQNQGAVTTDEGNIAAAKLNIAYCHIAAPIPGHVGLRLVDPGNLVSAAAGTPLVVITQTEPITVIFTLPEQQVPPVLKRVRAGQRLPVDALGRDSQTPIAHGELTTLDNQIDQTTGTLRLRATFTNRDEALFPNQFVNAQVLVEQKRGVTLVPNAAVQRNGSTTFVFLLKPDHTVTVRNVTVGTINAQESEIASGLAPGDVVVTQGVDRLQEGSHVQAQIQPPEHATTSAQNQHTSEQSDAPQAASNRSRSKAVPGTQRQTSAEP